jgi:hypothetical protein
VIFGVAVLSNCELKETGNPGLDVSSMSDLGASIGTVWTNGQATDLSTSNPANWDGMAISDPVIIKQGNNTMV